MRRARGWGMVAAAVALGALGVFLLTLPSDPTPAPELVWRVTVTPLAPDSIDGSRGAASAPEGMLEPSAPAARGAGVAAGPARADLTVTVVSGAGRAPLPGASVWLLEETERSLVEGWACLTRPVAGPVLTDAQGRAPLPWGDAAGTCRVVAHAPGHAAAQVRVEVGGPSEVRVALPPGLSLKGLVVDPSGYPQSELLLVARAAARPRQETESTAGRGPEVPDPGAERLTTRSGRDGAFTFDGLSAGTYIVTTEEPGWVVRGLAPPSTGDPLPGSRGLVARAGESGARLVVSRVGLVSLHLVDAVSREDLAVAWTTASLRLPGRPDATTVTSYAGRAVALPTEGGEPLILDPAQQPPARIVAALPWDASAAHAEVEVRAAGYRSGRAMAPIHPMPAGGAGGLVHLAPLVLALERETPPGPCRLVLDCARDTGGVHRPATRLLTLCRTSDGTRLHIAGRRVDGERWLFAGLPVGEAVAEVWDGLSFSKPVEVTLAAEVETEARAAFGPLTGALFVLRDARGRRIYDAEALLIAPQGRERGLPDRAEATRLRPGLELLVPLEAGEYRFGVSKPGVGYAGGGFAVRQGEVARVEAHLALPQAATGAGRPR